MEDESIQRELRLRVVAIIQDRKASSSISITKVLPARLSA
jgi:hypothetical protein